MGAANPALMPVVLKISEAAPAVRSEVAQGEDSGPVEAFAWLANDFDRSSFADFLLTGEQSP
jgi:hypothetical protein